MRFHPRPGSECNGLAAAHGILACEEITSLKSIARAPMNVYIPVHRQIWALIAINAVSVAGPGYSNNDTCSRRNAGSGLVAGPCRNSTTWFKSSR